ncbi:MULTISPECIES: hypothetical protein [unclassified Anaeromyxobacter]|uniref:hypothetical protein n=1 Tax=unclassified Anaeromyxobacter TaxID=2620896 RepID=UPI001F57677D|nr:MULTISPECIES: hypothetical protein [unclassified Anaeromyxobacter]
MTSRSRSVFVVFSAVVAIGGFTACGGGTQVTTSPLPERIEVRVSAGAPVAGAVVTVYAISDVTGLKDETVGGGGVLGSAGPTDSTGAATITLASRSYSGPVQIVASGPALFYADPTVAAESGSSAAVIQIPATFSLSSYVPRFSTAAPIVPVTLLTTLADRAALAWARGRHPAQRTPSTLTAALGARDPLFVAHVTKDAAAWSPSALRSTVPAPLAARPQTLVDSTYAALLDIALNQLAHDVAARAGYGASSNAITAVTLAQLLQDDLDADGRFDGRGVGGLLLATPGNPPVALDEQLLRVPLALALDTWIRNGAANRSGIGQADLVSAKVYEALTTDASDLFGGPPSPGTFDPVDRSPPVLSFITSAPAFTNQQTLTLALSATDATGVKGVFAQAGGRRFTGTPIDGGWNVPVELVPGHNIVTIWAEDTAQAANTGLGSTEPHQFTLDILLDTAPPAVLYDATFASYVPEEGITVATDPDGTARVPADPNMVGRFKEPISTNGEIFKMATRLSAGGSLDVAELEGANTPNIPVLRFAVHHDPAIESPMVEATYAVQLDCAGCEYPARSGALLPSPTSTPSFLYFDLPLATETVPHLANVTGTASVTVTLSFRDAAGNAAPEVDGGTYTFHVVGPALAVAEDLAYPQAGDPKSTFMYSASAVGYAALFDPAATAFLPDRRVRLVKYVITNPWPVPVLAEVRLEGGAWNATETWRGEMLRMPGLAYNADGMSFAGITDWAATCNGIPTFPCGGTAADQDAKYPVHFPGSTTQYSCDTKPGVSGSTSPWASPPADIVGTQQAAAAPELRAFAPGGPWDATPATSLGGQLVVPAATATAPGRVHVYVTRPAGLGGRTIPLAFGTLNPSSPVARFETWEWDHWMDTDPSRLSCTYQTFTLVRDCGRCGYNSLGCLICAVPITITNSYRHWWAYRHIRYLAAAADNLTGGLSVSSQGLVADGTRPFGEASVQASRIEVGRSIDH